MVSSLVRVFIKMEKKIFIFLIGIIFLINFGSAQVNLIETIGGTISGGRSASGSGIPENVFDSDLDSLYKVEVEGATWIESQIIFNQAVDISRIKSIYGVEYYLEPDLSKIRIYVDYGDGWNQIIIKTPTPEETQVLDETGDWQDVIGLKVRINAYVCEGEWCYTDYTWINELQAWGIAPCGDNTCDNSGGETCSNCPADCGECYQDIGLKIYDGTGIVNISVYPLGTLDSNLRIRSSDGNTYAVVLVPVGDSMASKVRIQTSTGIMALMKY